MLEKIYNAFDIDEKFDILMYKTGAFISGGSALSTFLKEDILIEQDLDIFLRIPYTKETDYGLISENSTYYPFENLSKELIHTYLTEKGYERDYGNQKYKLSMKELETKELEYHKSAQSRYIKQIINYGKTINGNLKKIQLIILYDCSIDNFLNTFDLNICRLALVNVYDVRFYHHVQPGYIFHDELQLIKDKKMYIHNVLYPPNISTRIKKYINRGFTLVSKNTYEPIFENPSLEEIDDYVKNEVTQKIKTYEDLKDDQHREMLQKFLIENTNKGRDIIKEISEHVL